VIFTYLAPQKHGLIQGYTLILSQIQTFVNTKLLLGG